VKLKPLRREKMPFEHVPREYFKGARWVELKLLAEVKYTNVTRYGVLRQASFVGLRDDSAARQLRGGSPELSLETICDDRGTRILPKPERRPLASSAGRGVGARLHQARSQSCLCGRTPDIELGTFIAAGGHGPEHQELLRLIGTLVEKPIPRDKAPET
jgi:hypothetical protein